MENSEIINKLIGNPEKEKELEIIEKETGVGSIRIISIRYKFYSIIIITLILIGVFNYVLPKYESFKATKNRINGMQADIDRIENKRKEYEKDTILAEKIEKSENQIIECLNNQVGCKILDEEIRNNFSEAVSFLQVNSLYNPKMNVDEKTILKNINEYLMRQDKNFSTRNGEINKISIGESSEFKDDLFYVTIALNVTFQNKDGLLSFIDNIEKKVNPDKDFRILYKIDEVSYDIMNYEEEQNVDIFLKAYYYKI